MVLPTEQVRRALSPYQVHTNIHIGVIQLDPYLSPFEDALKHRFSKAQKWIQDIDQHEGGLEKFSRVSTH